jgi:hypothetical protein
MKSVQYPLFKVIGIQMLFLTVSFGAYSGGDGSPGDPYRIANAADWQHLADTEADWDDCFSLIADINLKDAGRLAPVGNSLTPFTGDFEGNRHVILQAVIRKLDTDYVGLFGMVGANGEIRNLGVSNVNITGRNNVGGLTGANQGTITSCYVTGAVTGEGSFVGGLVGINWQTITACYAAVTLTGRGQSIGGLVGQNQGPISSCYTSGSVEGGDLVGGLVGWQIAGAITNSYATAAVTSSLYPGGLIGKINLFYSLTGCFWDMQTSGQAGSGSGKGLTTLQMKTVSIFQNAGWSDSGWVMQEGQYPRLDWENTGWSPIPAAGPTPLPGSGAPGDPYQIANANHFALLSWYTDILNKHIVLTADMDLSTQNLYPIGDLGPFTGVFDGNGHTLYYAAVNQPVSDNIGLFCRIGAGGQVRNLNLENAAFTGRDFVGALAASNYQGIINNCHASGNVIGQNDYSYTGGLVGSNYEGLIVDCSAAGAVIGGHYVGGLAGYNGGTIIVCHATNTVTGQTRVGGLVGMNGWQGYIRTSYAAGDAIGQQRVGGLVGENTYNISSCYAIGSAGDGGNYIAEEVGGLVGYNDSGTIDSCYAMAAASGSEIIGGLIGRNEGTIINCYAAGPVYGFYWGIGGLVGDSIYGATDSFWDTQATGQSTSAAGMPKNTSEMKTQSTFTGWDFVGDETDGMTDIWRLCVDGTAYPALNWQFSTVGDLACPDGVGIEDLAYLAERWLDAYAFGFEGADATGDEQVNFMDFDVLFRYW